MNQHLSIAAYEAFEMVGLVVHRQDDGGEAIGQRVVGARKDPRSALDEIQGLGGGLGELVGRQAHLLIEVGG